MTVIFTKQLSNTDVEHRLAIRMASLEVFGIPEGQHSAEFDAIDSSGTTWRFRISTRADENHSMPVIAKGWIPFARHKDLITNDWITLYDEPNDANGIRFRVQEEKKPVPSFGSNIRD